MAMTTGTGEATAMGRAGRAARWAMLVSLVALLSLGGPASAVSVKKEKQRQVTVKSPQELYSLALMNLHGTMVHRDEKQAFRLMVQAAGKGYPPAIYYLGVLYHDGVGIKADRQKAAVWLAKSADLCDPQGEFSYGLVLLAGDGVEPDPEEGLEMIGRAAGRGYAPAADFLRRLVSYGGPSPGEPLGQPLRPLAAGDKDGRSGLAGGGLVLDQGGFSLKFSLPDLSAPPYPRIIGEERLLDRLQGGKVELIVPLGKGK